LAGLPRKGNSESFEVHSIMIFAASGLCGLIKYLIRFESYIAPGSQIISGIRVVHMLV
jgi:hypothetical protein